MSGKRKIMDETEMSWKEWLENVRDPVVMRKLVEAKELEGVWRKHEEERKVAGDEENHARMMLERATRVMGKASSKAKDAAVEYGEALLEAWKVAAGKSTDVPVPGGVGKGGEASGYAKFAMAYESASDVEEAFDDDGAPNHESDAWAEWKGMKKREHVWSQNAMREGEESDEGSDGWCDICLLYTSPSPRDQRGSRMPSSA